MSRARQAAEARGRWAEWLAMAWLAAKGYRLLDRRARTPAGEIDLVACRGEYIAFIEVKLRPSVAEARDSVGPRQRQRIERAASLWLARHDARFRELGGHLDVMEEQLRLLSEHNMPGPAPKPLLRGPNLHRLPRFFLETGTADSCKTQERG